MTRALTLLACVLLSAACSVSRSPSAGSQTHFLKACDASCPSPYSCLCGVCTLPCTSESVCRDQAEGAMCQAATDGCMLSGKMCDVTCDADRDCQSLGSKYECSEGRCRLPSREPEAGARECADHAKTVAAYLQNNSSCTEDWDCTMVGSCSAGFGFEAVAVSGREGAQALSNSSPCPQFDGLLFRAYCNQGRCAKDETGGGCGQFDPRGAVCDGSDDIRVAARVHGGFISLDSYEFAAPHGYGYFVIDGKCRYYAQSDRDGRLHSGTLSEADAELFFDDMNYGDLDRWNGMTGGSVADCAETHVMTQSSSFKCVCGCVDKDPTGMRNAARASASWIERLAAQSSPSTGPLRAMARSYSGTPPTPAVAWPLARSIESIAGLIETASRATESSGVRFEMADAAALRAVRPARPVNQALYVTDGGKLYALYQRDELPEAVETAFDALLSKSK